MKFLTKTLMLLLFTMLASVATSSGASAEGDCSYNGLIANPNQNCVFVVDELPIVSGQAPYDAFYQNNYVSCVNLMPNRVACVVLFEIIAQPESCVDGATLVEVEEGRFSCVPVVDDEIIDAIVLAPVPSFTG